MTQLGDYARLPILRFKSFGAYLDGGDLGEILLPQRDVPEEAVEGDEVDVFLYLDSEERPIATTRDPLVTVGEAAVLKVVDANKTGIFLDWGLEKDLMVPHTERRGEHMAVGERYAVACYLDRTGRICASPRLHKHFSETEHEYQQGDCVLLLVVKETKLGYKVLINKGILGLLHRDEVRQELAVGDEIKGFVKNVRDDRKVDLTLARHDAQGRVELTAKIVSYLKENNGRMNIHDKSPPQVIADTFGVSKKQFKRALGNLMKRNRISLEPGTVILNKR